MQKHSHYDFASTAILTQRNESHSSDVYTSLASRIAIAPLLKIAILSYYFTKNRPLKISEIEKINRQTLTKNELILPKSRSFQDGALI